MRANVAFIDTLMSTGYIDIDSLREAGWHGLTPVSPWAAMIQDVSVVSVVSETPEMIETTEDTENTKETTDVTFGTETTKDIETTINYKVAPACVVPFAAAATAKLGLSVVYGALKKTKKTKIVIESRNAHGSLGCGDIEGQFWMQPYLPPFKDANDQYILVETKPTKRADVSPLNDNALTWLVFEIGLPDGFSEMTEATAAHMHHFMIVSRVWLQSLIVTKQRELDARDTIVNVLNKDAEYKVYQKGRRNQRQTLVPIADLDTEDNKLRQLVFFV